jgi:hypothetical protein
MKSTFLNFIFFVLMLSISMTIQAKEWKSLKHYQKSTHQLHLSPLDWLESDRKHYTLTWQNANLYNLSHNNPEEYTSIKQRRDFYEWIDIEFTKKGHEVVWQDMAYFISLKLRLIEVFPFNIFTSKALKKYVKMGSKVVFDNAFVDLKIMYFSDDILKSEEALQWDTAMLYEEQYHWLESVYKVMDPKRIEQVQFVASGKFIYGLVIPREIRFKGAISNPEDRFNYAMTVLRPYCKKHLK